jgi:hypothetical protein
LKLEGTRFWHRTLRRRTLIYSCPGKGGNQPSRSASEDQHF